LQWEDDVRDCKIEPSSSSFGREKLHGGTVLQECTAPVIGLTWIDLASINLNGNQLVGQIPQALANLKLDKLDLGNNQFMGPIPKFQYKCSYH
jgi:hypothetical protein